MKLNDYIKYERKKQKLTLVQLSKKAAISYGMLYRLEEGAIKQPKPHLLKQVAVALKINYENLLLQYGYLSLDEKKQKQRVSQKKDVIALSSFINNTKEVIGTMKYMIEKQVHYQVQCDSNRLMPIAKKGDIVGLKKVKTINENNIYLSIIANDITVYLAKKRGEDVRLVNYPKQYDDITEDETNIVNDMYKLVFRHSDASIFTKKETI
ncbi:hypothetical protein DID74_00495 [Candidatus Marinamargulisbacteria bacterium SCGC AG-333-B06]|nr:hypothetical protein DID74_00495 [Candidatus Marinamargulisbacteria bacterium SCGC AG-333-B06]